MDQLTCPSTPCTCGGAPPTPGHSYVASVGGTVQGAVGTFLQVNLPVALGGQIDCGSWSPDPCPLPGVLRCCKRTSPDQPDSTTWQGTFLPFQGECDCSGQSYQLPMVAQVNNPNFDGQYKDAGGFVGCP